MYCLQLNSFILICIYLAAFASVSSQANEETRSVKKDLKITATADAARPLDPANQSQSTNLTNDVKSKEENSIVNIRKAVLEKELDDVGIPESFKLGFYFFIGLSFAAMLFILVKIYRMRLSRAERKYGVQGDRTTQELTPLPTAIEDDSDNDDHTLFDINKQVRVS